MPGSILHGFISGVAAGICLRTANKLINNMSGGDAIGTSGGLYTGLIVSVVSVVILRLHKNI